MPDALARRDRRAGQFRRLPPRPPGGGRRGGRLGARPRAGRRSSPRSIRTRCATSRPHAAAVPPDHARPARGAVRRRRRRRDAGVPLRRRAGRRMPAEDFVGELLARPPRRGGRGDRRGLHLRQGPRRQSSRCCASTARSSASPRARSARCTTADGRSPPAASATALKAGDCATATRLLTRPFAIRGIGPARRQARAGRSAIPPPTSSSAPTCARATASTR